MIVPIVTFVLPTYNRVSELRTALSSLISQTNINWEAIVVIDSDEHQQDIREMIHKITSKRDFRIRVLVTDKRYNDWGHTPRELGKQMAEGKYVIMSGDDNYYVPTFVEEISKVAQNNYGMIYWDMVHSHYNYQLFKTLPAFNQIDIGAFATRIDLAKKIKLKTTYAADGEYVEEFKTVFPNESIIKIEKVLYVHN